MMFTGIASTFNDPQAVHDTVPGVGAAYTTCKAWQNGKIVASADVLEEALPEGKLPTKGRRVLVQKGTWECST
jgi:hypothetical protein